MTLDEIRLRSSRMSSGSSVRRFHALLAACPMLLLLFPRSQYLSRVLSVSMRVRSQPARIVFSSCFWVSETWLLETNISISWRTIDRLRTLCCESGYVSTAMLATRNDVLGGNVLELLWCIGEVRPNLLNELNNCEKVANTESETHLCDSRWATREGTKGIVATASFNTLFQYQIASRVSSLRGGMLHGTACCAAKLPVAIGWPCMMDKKRLAVWLSKVLRCQQLGSPRRIGHRSRARFNHRCILCRWKKTHGNHSFADGQATSFSLEFGSQRHRTGPDACRTLLEWATKPVEKRAHWPLNPEPPTSRRPSQSFHFTHRFRPSLFTATKERRGIRCRVTA